MATNYSANQYQSAFTSYKLQNWSIPKAYKERPSTHDGHTQFITNDRGHLLPGVPKSKASPWGTFIGTWDIPLKIPPSKLNLTSRSANASKRLVNWIQSATPLISACNGLQPQITGKVSQSADNMEDNPVIHKPSKSISQEDNHFLEGNAGRNSQEPQAESRLGTCKEFPEKI
ncbi:protein Flattop-like [Bombina bombina]|uniref:protein Flattop-like n=1 Tax=Bombina bombina TaxID=8345 RepID=UPI00235B084C|nr:protein Flattop-like [Bombina bombina]